MANVIRQDVVQIGFEIENNPLKQLTEELNKIKKSITGVADNDSFSEVAEEANKAQKAVKGLTNETKQAGSASSGIQKLKDNIDKTVKSLTGGEKGAKAFSNTIKNIGKSGVDKLKSGFDSVKTAVGNATSKVKEFAKTSFEKLKIGLKAVKDKLVDIGKKAGGTAYEGLKKVAGVSFKAMTAGLTAAAGAVGGLVTKSVQSFADYEQLVGGVDTLFKDASGIVQKNAANAFKTSGLSANQYMETVTSFSASLISSVGGDTKKAAEMSDMALRDMSDNANKMGTDMEMIMGTYQSLSRGNFAMLDNLKLGYGGSKKEMERLVKDAAKIDESVKSNDMSFGNMVKAIHAVQTQMDITGTTSKEAATTISGSLSSMKSAWQNTLTALVIGGESFDTSVDQLVESALTFGKNIMPAILKALDGVGALIEKLAPIIAEHFPPMVEKLIPPLISAAWNLFQGLIKALPTIVKTVVMSLVDVIGKEFPAAKNALKGFGDGLINHAGLIAKGIIGAFAIFKGVKIASSIVSLFSKGGGGGKGGLFDGITKSLTKLGKTKTGVISKGILNLGIILGGFSVITAVCAAIMMLVSKYSDTRTMLEMAAVMGALGIVGGVLAIFAGIVGKIPITTVLKGLANMAIVLGGMGALLFAATIVFKDGVNFAQMYSTIKLIGILGTVGSVLSVFAGIVGLIPIPIVLAGLANIGLVIGGMTALILAYGKLSEIPNFNEFISKGGDTLANLFRQIGKIGGALIGGIGEGITSSMPKIAENLSDFAKKIKPMFETFSGCDVSGAGAFLNAIASFALKMGASEVLSFLTGSPDFEGLAKGLGTLACDDVKNFFTMVQGIGDDAFKKGKDFFVCVDEVSRLPNVGGIAQVFSGTNDFSGVATGLGQLNCEGVKGFFAMVQAFEQLAFDNAKKFFEALDGISSLPNVGGIGQVFSGTNDFSGVASGLKELQSNGVRNFFAMVQELPVEVFEKTKKMFSALADISKLNAEGGFMESLGNMFGVGEESPLKGIADGMKYFAHNTKAFFEQVNGINLTKLRGLWSSLERAGDLVEISLEGLPEKGAAMSKFMINTKAFFTGASDVASHINAVNSVAIALDKFFTTVNGIVVNSLNGINSGLKTMLASIVKSTSSFAVFGTTLVTSSLTGAASIKMLKSVMVSTMNQMDNVVKINIDKIVKRVSELPQKMGDAIKKSGGSLTSAMVSIWQAAVQATAKPINKLISGANWLLKEFGSNKRIVSWVPYAKGTDGHKGGNALVNDGRGAEIVQMPNGNTFIPKGRNVMIPNAPVGMKVLSAEKTAEVMGKSSPTFRYASGIGSIDIWEYMDNAKGLIESVKKRYVSYEGVRASIADISKAMVSTVSNAMVPWAKKLFDEFGVGKGWKWPSISRYITSPFGKRRSPGGIGSTNHMGIDIGASYGSPVFASKGGTVSIAGWAGGYGNLVQIDHGQGWSTRYGHNSALLVSAGQRVRQGQTIALVGSTGNSTGPHIHFEIRHNGASVNPSPLLNQGYANGGFASKPSIFGEDGLEVAIPLTRDKRDRARSLYEKTGSILGYSPENSAEVTSGGTHITENNEYAPQFVLNMNGTSDDRSTERKVKRWIREAMDDMIESMSRNHPRLREV